MWAKIDIPITHLFGLIPGVIDGVNAWDFIPVELHQMEFFCEFSLQKDQKLEFWKKTLTRIVYALIITW